MQVRAHAVEVLKRTEDEELLYYLLQLVQALRFEETNDSPLAQFLVERAVANPTLAFTLHWCSSAFCKSMCANLLPATMNTVACQHACAACEHQVFLSKSLSQKHQK